METAVAFAVFALGLIVGSFLNVLVLRRGTGLSVARGRSRCFSCGRTLAWYELLPLASFAALRGKCRTCGARISWQYPLVELATGFAFVLAYALAPDALATGLGIASFALLAALLSVYIAIVAYDILHMIIPDTFSYAAGLIALCLVGVDSLAAGSVDPARIVAGPALFLFFYILWFVSRGRWMGLGDAKLALSIGWALGPALGIAALLVSFWAGSIVAIAYMAILAVIRAMRGKGSSFGLGSLIPFGPFLVLGFVIVLAWHLDIQTLLAHLAV